MKRKNLLFTVLFILFQVAVFAQSRVIKGVIKDSETKEGIPGVGVLVVGSSTATTTDVNGAYSITVEGEGKKLIFTYVGYANQTVSADKEVIDITLMPSSTVLNETVVTAVGIKVEKKRIGYSIQDVKGDDISKASNTDMISGLSGKVAGATVIGSGGSPGASTFIKLRGSNSLTGSNQPLIVIDGIPFSNEMFGNSTAGVSQSNRAMDINPDDIENVTILKGPAATALYGISASNGAMIITTKKGSKPSSGKKLNVSYSSSLTFDRVNKLPELQTKFSQGVGGKYAGPEKHVRESWGANVDTLYWDGDASYLYDTHGKIVYQSNPNKKGKVTPYDNVGTFFQTGIAYDNSIALSGGNDEGAFRFSASHLSQTGIVPLADFGRTTLKLAGETKLSEKFRVSGSASYVKSGGRRQQQGSNLSGVMLGLTRTPITFDNSNGKTDPTDSTAYILSDGSGAQRNYRGGRGYDNPYYTLNENKFHDDVNRTFGFGQVDYTALKWLSFTYRLGTDLYSDRRKESFPLGAMENTSGSINQRQYYYQHINSDLIARASTKIATDLNGAFVVGNNMYNQYYQKLEVKGSDLTFVGFDNISNATHVLAEEEHKRLRRNGYYADVKFDYKSMLYLGLTGRQDRSSTLPANNNKFFYPSASLAFVFTELLKMNNNKYLPFGKLRVSYAQVGHDASAYSLKSYYANGTAGDGWTTGITFPFNGTGGFSSKGTLGNANLKPEKTNAFEIGTELRLIKNRITVDISYYSSKSIDQILDVPISGATGYNFMTLNTGSIQNKGVEIALTASPIKMKNFQWDLGFNWSHNQSKVIALTAGVENLFMGGFENAAIYAVVDKPYGQIYGGRWLRNNDGKLIIDDDKTSANYGKPIVDSKLGVIGDINPKWIGGITNTFTYKRISLYSLISIKQGGDIWNGTRGTLAYIGTAKMTEDRGITKIFDGVKQSNGTANDISTPLDQAWYQGNGGGFGSQAEDFVEDGSFIRLRELSLSYSVNPKFLEKAHIGSLDVSLFGRNLWLSTKYTGVDPETSLLGADNAQGMDYYNMPNTRSMGVRLRVTL
jgi:TonB-linked SusC/RagA family outer membrane protein